MRVDTGNETMEEREDEKNAEMIDKAKAGEKGTQTEDGTRTAMTRETGAETRDVTKIEEETVMVVTETGEEPTATTDATGTTIHHPHRTRRTPGRTPRRLTKKGGGDHGEESAKETNDDVTFTRCGGNSRNNGRRGRMVTNLAGSS